MHRGFSGNNSTHTHVVVVILIVLILMFAFGYFFRGPSKEDFLKFHSLKKEAQNIEQMVMQIEEEREKIVELQKKLQTRLPKEEAFDAIKKLGIRSVFSESLIKRYNKEINTYNQEVLELPRTLSDSLRIFVNK